jgi:hypothetical protein
VRACLIATLVTHWVAELTQLTCTGGEHMIVNVWRPIQPTPVAQWSLCALDGSTLRQGDVHPTTIVKFNNTPGGRTGGTALGHESSVVVRALIGAGLCACSVRQWLPV